MKRIIATFGLAFAISFMVNAQDLTDALRYSYFQTEGTARAAAMGNAFGALGGDFTSISINPAGVGLYRSSELVLTPSFGQNQVKALYMGNSMSEKSYKFALNNIGYVATIPAKGMSESGLVSFNLGIGYNRLKDFNSYSIVGANNLNSSYLDFFADEATKGYWNDYYNELAWGTYLLKEMILYDEKGEGIEIDYWHYIEKSKYEEKSKYGQSQRKIIDRQGSMNEFSLSAGFNFNHKFYFGVSLGIVDLYYKEKSEIYEWDRQNRIDFFDEMRFNSNLETTGTGYNVALGVIYKPINSVRFGASIKTPTFYNLHDYFYTTMSSTVVDDYYEWGSFEAKSPQNGYDYDLESPFKFALSAAYVFPKVGLLSIDYELSNYSSASLRRGGEGYNFIDENNEIAEVYKTAGVLRIGGEYIVTDNFSLRAGLENYGSPYNSDAYGFNQPNSDAKLRIYSAGFGYRAGGFFLDMAYRHKFDKSWDRLYNVYSDFSTDRYEPPQFATFTGIKNSVTLSMGFKF